MPKSSVEQYKEFQEYTNYIDTSDVMLGFYKNEEGSGLEKYLLMIEQWLALEQSGEANKPLVIEGDGGVGKKTLLVKWFEHHQSMKPKNKKDLTILHFATTGGNNSNYFYAIYRILTKLREELNIGQKVELHEEKIRKYFSYWLDVCNQRIEDESFQNSEIIYEKIILVFQGIDYFIDRSSGKEGNIAFWLPKFFPKNVKVIITADGESESIKYFNKLQCQKVIIPSDPNLMQEMIGWQSEKELCIQGPMKDKLVQTLRNILKKTEVASLFVKTYLSCLVPEKMDGIELQEESLKFIQSGVESIELEKLSTLSSIDELFDYLLQFWGTNLFHNEEKFKDLLGILISTQKGLTRSEIISITGITQEELNIFITLFSSFLMNFKQLWMIKNDCFKKAINNKYVFQYVKLSEKTAQVLKKTPNSVRKLEEETFHLYSAGNYFKLKEVISDIENFLLLFNPYTKYDLCKYWQKLEEKSFDPVIEYNKAIEGFEMHYHPTADDLFRIITQISRFLKEFSDFENYFTPSFRHPKIIGNENELEDIGILGELRNLQMCYETLEQYSKAIERRPEEEEIDGNENNQNDDEKRLKKKVKEMYDKIEQGKHIKKSIKIETQSKEMNTTIKKIDRKKKQKVLTVQQQNIEIKLNQENFRKHYFEGVKNFLQKNLLDDKEEGNNQTKDNQEYEDSDEQTKRESLGQKIKNIEKEKERQKSKNQITPDLKNFYVKSMQEEFEINQKPPSNYYYKRWIWMQYPWSCLTMKCDYSDKLRKCFTSPTSYMPVSEERQFTLQALKIALEAKRKKQAILQKTQNISSRKTDLKQLSVSNRYLNKDSQLNSGDVTSSNFKSKGKKKFEQVAYSTNTFLSFSVLEKEMQGLNIKNLKDSNATSKTGAKENSDSRNCLFITSEDKTYQEYSSLLHSFNKKKKKQLFNQSELSITVKTRQQGLLPRIKQNFNDEMINELMELEKNNDTMRREVDNYLYKNKALAKKVKELKIIQQNGNNEAKNEKKIETTKIKISQLQEKIEKVKYQYAFSLMEYDRLNVLIKICQQNKTQNEEAIPDLVLECNNIKKMINIETFTINEINKKNEEIKKISKKLLQNCEDKMRNEAHLNQQIAQTLKNKENFQDEVEKYDELILDEVEDRRKVLNNRAKSIHQKSEQEKNIERYKAIMHLDDEESYGKIYSQIKQHFDIDSESFRKDPKYVHLIEGLQKKKELESIQQQKRAEVEQIEILYNKEKRDLETLEKAEDDVEQIRQKMQHIQERYENEIPVSESEQILIKKLQDKKRTLKKMTEVKLSCLGMLNTWYSKMNLPEQSELVILPEFLENVQTAKISSV